MFIHVHRNTLREVGLKGATEYRRVVERAYFFGAKQKPPFGGFFESDSE